MNNRRILWRFLLLFFIIGGALTGGFFLIKGNLLTPKAHAAACSPNNTDAQGNPWHPTPGIRIPPCFDFKNAVNASPSHQYTTLSGHGFANAASDTFVLPSTVNSLTVMGTWGADTQDGLNNRVEDGADLSAYPARVYHAGDVVPNLTLLPPDSSINIHNLNGQTNPNVKVFTVSSSMTLKQILTQLPNARFPSKDLFWSACQTVSGGSNYTVFHPMGIETRELGQSHEWFYRYDSTLSSTNACDALTLPTTSYYRDLNAAPGTQDIIFFVNSSPPNTSTPWLPKILSQSLGVAVARTDGTIRYVPEKNGTGTVWYQVDAIGKLNGNPYTFSLVRGHQITISGC